MASDTYWAAEGSEKLPDRVAEKVDQYVRYVQATGRDRLWRKAMRLFYGRNDRGDTSHDATSGGSVGELIRLRTNLLRTYLQARIVLVGGSWPSLAVRTNADDARATEQIPIGNAIVDDCSYRHCRPAFAEALKLSMLCGEGWIDRRWDWHAGRPYAAKMNPDGSKGIAWEGDITITARGPDCVIRDTEDRAVCRDWQIIRSDENKWTLAARYPEHAPAILNAKRDHNWEQIEITDDRDLRHGNSDRVAVYELFHRQTDALPSGRYALICGGAVLMLDEMPYDRLPARALMPDKEIGRALGYGDAWDLMGPQEIIDSIVSIMASVRENFGARDVWTPPNSKLKATDLAPGFKHIESLVKPEILDHSAGYVAEAVAAIEFFDGVIRSASKVNDVVMGDAGKSSSGAALMAMQASAQQANSDSQRELNMAIEDTMSMVLKLYQKFAKTERIISMAGKLKAPVAKKFKADDISALDGVQIELGSPLMNTAIGRKEIADGYLQKGLITPKQHMEVCVSGRLDPVNRRVEAQLALREEEDEQLALGGQPPVAITHDHPRHIESHADELDRAVAANDIARIQRVTQHINEHMAIWKQADPDLLTALGIDLPPSTMMMLQGGGQQPPPPDAQPGADPNAPAPPDNTGAPQDGSQPLPEQPNPGAEMPEVPQDFGPELMA